MPRQTRAPGFPTNPILQVLYFLAAGVLLIGAVLMGAIILAFVIGAAVVAGLVIYIRVWWLKRKLGRRARRNRADVLEVEYTIVDERDDDDRRG